MKYYHHGDCLLIPVEKVEGKEIKGNILLEGEVTGHAHRIKENTAKLYMDKRNVMFVEVTAPSALTHEEHGRIELPEGLYRVDRVKEYDPFEKELRDVAD